MRTSDLKALRLIPLALLIAMSASLQAKTIEKVQEGDASYYANSLNGKKTARGEPYDKNALTAAHRKLPFGTKVKVTYLKTGKSVVVEINDRGPYAKGRLIDLSGAAAKKLGMLEDGHGKVKLEVLAP